MVYVVYELKCNFILYSSCLPNKIFFGNYFEKGCIAKWQEPNCE
jgi:hypothetical protein